MLTLFSFIKIAHQLQHNSIITIIKEFNLNNPYFIGSVDKKLDLLKALSRNGQFWNIHPSIENIFVNEKITKNSILLPKSQGKNNYHLDFPKNPYWSCLLISESKNFEDLLNIVAAQTDISQKVFILKHDSHEIYEAYKINHVIVKKKLGHVDMISNKFKWQKDVHTDFITRRSDFHGIVLKGIVGFIGWNMFATDFRYREKTPYFKNNDTHQVNGFTNGLFHDVLMTLQDRLNFTTILYKRNKDVWGSIHYENGTYKGIGMMGDIFFKTVDIGVTSFTMSLERALYVDYLFPIKDTKFGIYIPTSNAKRFDFETYLAPFSLLLWITLGVTGVTFASLRFLLLKVHGSEAIFGFDDIWSSFSGILGRKPPPTPIDKKSSYKTMIIVTLLCSTVVWISYRARLNATLSVQKKEYLFHDMESFSNTNWR